MQQVTNLSDALQLVMTLIVGEVFRFGQGCRVHIRLMRNDVVRLPTPVIGSYHIDFFRGPRRRSWHVFLIARLLHHLVE